MKTYVSCGLVQNDLAYLEEQPLALGACLRVREGVRTGDLDRGVGFLRDHRLEVELLQSVHLVQEHESQWRPLKNGISP